MNQTNILLFMMMLAMMLVVAIATSSPNTQQPYASPVKNNKNDNNDDSDLIQSSLRLFDSRKPPPSVFELFYNTLESYMKSDAADTLDDEQAEAAATTTISMNGKSIRSTKSQHRTDSLSINDMFTNFNHFAHQLGQLYSTSKKAKVSVSSPTMRKIDPNTPLFPAVHKSWKQQQQNKQHQPALLVQQPKKNIGQEELELADTPSKYCSNKGYMTYQELDTNSCKGLSSCAPHLLICNGNTIMCLSLNMTCESKQTNCSVDILENLPCSLGCNTQLNTSFCDCPADTAGLDCSMNANYTCSLGIVHPTPKCTGNFVLSTTTCFEYKTADTAAFGFNMTCTFDQLPIKPSPYHKFSYWIDMPNFKLSNPVTWNVNNDIVDFNRLYDYSQTTSQPLSRDQIMGNQLVWFNTSLSSVPSQFWIARRLYVETSLAMSVDLNQTQVKYFIKSSDYPLNNATFAKMPGWKIALIVIGSVLAFAGVAFGTFYLYRKKLRV
ncbi:hypothetical protein SAMD00019534_026290, partial [Acytostelium subglobosum LB1]|uniref:hypothetical protein n=1 Tax=Acytostelium subglobosum LB1 TaxID=1410327 RepID=UPI000644A160